LKRRLRLERECHSFVGRQLEPSPDLRSEGLIAQPLADALPDVVTEVPLVWLQLLFGRLEKHCVGQPDEGRGARLDAFAEGAKMS
jgi:hypothetical protein